MAIKPRNMASALGCTVVASGQCRWIADESTKEGVEVQYSETPVWSSRGLWMPSRCWLAVHKPPGNPGKSWPRQNPKRETMWRQRNQHLSLAHPQTLPTQPSVQSSKAGELLVMKAFRLWKWPNARICVVVQLLNWYSLKQLSWLMVQSDAATLAGRIALSEFGSATNPWKLQCNCMEKSFQPLRSSCSPQMKKTLEIHLHSSRSKN